MPDWVHAAERAYVAAAVQVRAPLAPGVHVVPAAPTATTRARALAAAGAIASHYLAVGTPRSFGLLVDDAADLDAAALALAAHRAWFAPRDIRCAAARSAPASSSSPSSPAPSPSSGRADALAAATGGRVVSVDEALACDIVCVHGASIAITPAQLRRGTHVNALSADHLDPELAQLATLVREAGLPALAAGLVDGRQLDELTIFVIDGAPIALAALSAFPA